MGMRMGHVKPRSNEIEETHFSLHATELLIANH